MPGRLMMFEFLAAMMGLIVVGIAICGLVRLI